MRLAKGTIRFHAGIACVVFAGSIAQAGLLVAPNANTSTKGNAAQLILFGESGNESTFQWDLRGSQLTAMVGDTITALGFRLNAGSSSFGPSTISTFDLELSSSNNPIGSLSTTFANNIGANAVTVYNSPLILGSLTGGSGPNPFFLINFTTPFAYTGGDLLMTLLTSSESSFAVDANSYGDGLADTVSNWNIGGLRAESYTYPITEFQFTAGATTPEPASIALVAGGLIAIGARRRNRDARRLEPSQPKTPYCA
jgi:hypothetical protein